MAQCSPLSSAPCIKFNALLDLQCLASRHYFFAVAELVFLAGKQAGDRFLEAKRNCEICLENCKSATAALRAHRDAHGC